MPIDVGPYQSAYHECIMIHRHAVPGVYSQESDIPRAPYAYCRDYAIKKVDGNWPNYKNLPPVFSLIDISEQ